jgi:hypothetical protein
VADLTRDLQSNAIKITEVMTFFRQERVQDEVLPYVVKDIVPEFLQLLDTLETRGRQIGIIRESEESDLGSVDNLLKHVSAPGAESVDAGPVYGGPESAFRDSRDQFGVLRPEVETRMIHRKIYVKEYFGALGTLQEKLEEIIAATGTDRSALTAIALSPAHGWEDR